MRPSYNSLVGSSHGYKLSAGWEVPMAQHSAAHYLRPAISAHWWEVPICDTSAWWEVPMAQQSAAHLHMWPA